MTGPDKRELARGAEIAGLAILTEADKLRAFLGIFHPDIKDEKREDIVRRRNLDEARRRQA